MHSGMSLGISLLHSIMLYIKSTNSILYLKGEMLFVLFSSSTYSRFETHSCSPCSAYKILRLRSKITHFKKSNPRSTRMSTAAFPHFRFYQLTFCLSNCFQIIQKHLEHTICFKIMKSETIVYLCIVQKTFRFITSSPAWMRLETSYR